MPHIRLIYYSQTIFEQQISWSVFNRVDAKALCVALARSNNGNATDVEAETELNPDIEANISAHQSLLPPSGTTGLIPKHCVWRQGSVLLGHEEEGAGEGCASGAWRGGRTAQT